MIATRSRSYNYQSTLEASIRINWHVKDIIGGNSVLDFTKPFLAEALAGVSSIQCLSDREKLLLNQIRGNSYLNLFGLVEEFIVPLVVEHVQQIGYEDIHATQAFLHFAEEESKHIDLFRRFAEAFEQGFGTSCGCIGPSKAIGDAVLAHHPLGVALLVLHIEWMTQRHYLDSVQNNAAEDLDPQFCSLLKHHWLEESQHAKLDTLMVEYMAKHLTEQGIQAGIDAYFKIVDFLNGGLNMQTQLDIDSLSRASDRVFTGAEAQEIQLAQEASYRWVFLGSGMTHPNFLQTMGELSQAGLARAVQTARDFS
ncbi:hypothetical protein IQ268_28605 [Oculatella sp. LEGE 06141]|uniref:hypothetical protein n=1 Tax=Oculatella sp. LEGE 06141 TaxID=1828648 RepID=UPI001880C6DE|nr:hypothetical protein [Oculatella sp. LEGE 06141]MBE9182516.1 hypothetical protein [Oculatella sp. LEGE 06141]